MLLPSPILRKTEKELLVYTCIYYIYYIYRLFSAITHLRGNTDFFEIPENGSKPILSLCVARHDMTIIFFLFQVLSILYLFDQEMEPEQAEPPPHSHGQQPLSAVSNRTRSQVAQRSSCVARVIIGASSGVPAELEEDDLTFLASLLFTKVAIRQMKSPKTTLQLQNVPTRRSHG